jgi:hypothetical protein
MLLEDEFELNEVETILSGVTFYFRALRIFRILEIFNNFNSKKFFKIANYQITVKTTFSD